jgi:PKHD-type hydroxylase
MPGIHDCPRAFEAAECDALIALAQEGAREAAPVLGDAGYAVDTNFRDVVTAYRERQPATAWVFDRLDALFAEAAEALGMAVAPLSEPVQILRYGVGCHFQTWHSDAGFDLGGARLISVSAELSEPGDYEGGLLEIVPETIGRPRTLPRGGARFFASRALHRVTPVTRGVRWSLVAWTGAAH